MSASIEEGVELEEAEVISFPPICHHRNQFRGKASAAVVFIVYGMRLAWSIFDTPTGKFLDNSDTHCLMLYLFLGVGIGALTSMVFIQRNTAGIAFTLSGFLVISSGILNIVLPSNFIAVCYSSIAIGIAYGFSHVQSLVAGGELSHKALRGLLVSVERAFVWLGIILQLLYTRIWYRLEWSNVHIDHLHGILLAAFGVIVVALVLSERVDQKHLFEVVHDMDVRESTSDSSGIGPCLMTMFKIIILRCFATFILSLPFNRAFLVVSWHGFKCEMNCLHWLALCGLLGSITGAFLVDWRGRRQLCCMAFFVAGTVIFLIGGIFDHLEASKKIFYDIDLDTAACLMLLFVFVMSTGVAVPAFVYTAEAFSCSTRTYCIALTLLCEQLFQVGLMLMAFHMPFHNSTFFFILGVLSLILGLIVYVFMPETKNMKFNECLQKFKQIP